MYEYVALGKSLSTWNTLDACVSLYVYVPLEMYVYVPLDESRHGIHLMRVCLCVSICARLCLRVCMHPKTRNTRKHATHTHHFNGLRIHPRRIHISSHTYIDIYIHIDTHIDIQTHMLTFTYILTHTLTYTFILVE